jgi:hypothetical protein
MKDKRIQKVIRSFAVLLFAGVSLDADAALLAYDGFVAGTDNAAGEYVATPGTDTSGRFKLREGQNPVLPGFKGDWRMRFSAEYELGLTQIPSLAYSDGSAQLLTSGNAIFRKHLVGASSRALDNKTLELDKGGQTRYFSFLMKLDDPTVQTRLEFSEEEFGASGTGVRIHTDGANFIATVNGESIALAAADTDTHLFVWKLILADGVHDGWELFMDPELSSEFSNMPAAFRNIVDSSIDLSHLTILRGFKGGVGGNSAFFDEIRIGETWADVTPAQ